MIPSPCIVKLPGSAGSTARLLWLSHILSEDTPLYGGASGIAINRGKSISSGDSCNTSILTCPSHAGSHVDAPYHFLPEGRTVDSYPPETWVFSAPRLVEVQLGPEGLIGPEVFPPPAAGNQHVDLILIRTGLECRRSLPSYWQEGPGLSAGLAKYLCGHYPHLRAVGLDCISITTPRYRLEGHAAHLAFLGQGILLFEDLALGGIETGGRLIMVVALPLRLARGDGAPCTIIGWEEVQERSCGRS